MITILITSFCSCARWKEQEQRSRIVFPKSKIALDAVGLELGLAQLDSNQTDEFEAFWRLLDHQALPLDLRKRLDLNGFRVAIMPAHPPADLHDLVNPKPIVASELNALEKQLHAKGMLRRQERMIAHERISNREGQSHPIAVSGFYPNISWTVQHGNRVTPGFGESVRGFISVTTFPQGDGSVRLMFVPEIHHGQSRHRIGVAERSFLMQESQLVSKLSELKFEVTLRPGESVVVAPTADIQELGALFFGSAQNPESIQTGRSYPTHRMMLVRVVQTQMDDLFSDTNLVEKLTTTPRH